MTHSPEGLAGTCICMILFGLNKRRRVEVRYGSTKEENIKIETGYKART
jgi:hypothetical protein